MCAAKEARAKRGQKLSHLKWLKGYPTSTDCGQGASRVILMLFPYKDVTGAPGVLSCVSLCEFCGQLSGDFQRHALFTLQKL